MVDGRAATAAVGMGAAVGQERQKEDNKRDDNKRCSSSFNRKEDKVSKRLAKDLNFRSVGKEKVAKLRKEMKNIEVELICEMGVKF